MKVIIIGNPESSGWIHAHFAAMKAMEQIMLVGENIQNLSEATEKVIIPIAEFNAVALLNAKEVCNPLERFNRIRKFKR